MIWLSLPLGLLSWMIPLLFHKKKPTAVSAMSFGLCGLALLNVLWELFRRTLSGNYAALMDITDNLVWCSVILVIGAILLNLWLYVSTGFLRFPDRPIRFFIVLLVTLAAQTVLYLPGLTVTGFIGNRLSVGGAAGAVTVLLTYAGTVPFLTLGRKKYMNARLSWALPLGILLSHRIWNILFSFTCDFMPQRAQRW